MNKVKEIFYRSLHSLNAVRAKIFSVQPHCIILAYHRISSFKEQEYLLRDLIVEPSVFENQLRCIAKTHKIISLAKLVACLNNKTFFRENCAVVTFDDAYLDNYLYAFPILNKYNLPASIFVPTGFIETGASFWWDELAYMLINTETPVLNFQHRNIRHKFKLAGQSYKIKAFTVIKNILKYCTTEEASNLFSELHSSLKIKKGISFSQTLSWDQIQKMSVCNITFGAHSRSHCVLSLSRQQQLHSEIFSPKKLMEQRLRLPIEYFAYPYGEKKDFNQKIENLLKKAGYLGVLTMRQGYVFNTDNTFNLRRIGIGGCDTELSFQLKISGLLPLSSAPGNIFQ